MNRLTTLRTALFVLFIATIVLGQDKTPPTFQKGVPDYQKGTITKLSGVHTAYELKGPGMDKQISDCGDFQTGQVVDYREEGEKVYIRRENGKEYKCGIEATHVSETVAAGADKTPLTYQQGTITGWSTQHYPDNWSIGGNGVPVTTKHKFYDLKGTGTVYQINDCGDFQNGQAVGYRVDDADKEDMRIYIHRDNGKEYKCKIEGIRVEGAKADASSAAAPAAAH